MHDHFHFVVSSSFDFRFFLGRSSAYSNIFGGDCELESNFLF